MLSHSVEQSPDFDADFAEALRRCAQAFAEADQPDSKERISIGVRVAAIAVYAIVEEQELRHRPDAALEIFTDGLREHGGHESAKVTDVTTWRMMMRRARGEVVITRPEAGQSHRALLHALLYDQGAHFEIRTSSELPA